MYPLLDEADRLRRLTISAGQLRMVLDTDTFNEVDDQFALAYALLSPQRLHVEAIYAAPFYNVAPYSNHRSTSPGDGMEKSYGEILRLLDIMNVSAKGLVFKGADRCLASCDDWVASAAVDDLIDRALATPEGTLLYVVAIGAITNVASAIVRQPDIIRKIVVVWLGGQPHHWPDAREFNLSQDIAAAQVVFDCGVPLIQLPLRGVCSHMLTTLPELLTHIGERNELCNTLIRLFAAYSDDHFAWAKELWDVAAIACLIHPQWVECHTATSPVITREHVLLQKPGRHSIKVAHRVYRNHIFRDLFCKLGGA